VQELGVDWDQQPDLQISKCWYFC